MKFTPRKIVTSIAWALAFDSVTELAIAGAYGGWAGTKFGRSRWRTDEEMEKIVKEVQDEAENFKLFTSSRDVLPIVVGAVGLILGLMGFLPGTEDQ